MAFQKCPRLKRKIGPDILAINKNKLPPVKVNCPRERGKLKVKHFLLLRAITGEVLCYWYSAAKNSSFQRIGASVLKVDLSNALQHLVYCLTDKPWMYDIATDKEMNEGMIRKICLVYHLNKNTYSIFLEQYHIHHVQISNFHLEEVPQSELSSRSIHIFQMMNMEHESHPVEQKDNTNCLSEDNWPPETNGRKCTVSKYHHKE